MRWKKGLGFFHRIYRQAVADPRGVSSQIEFSPPGGAHGGVWGGPLFFLPNELFPLAPGLRCQGDGDGSGSLCHGSPGILRGVAVAPGASGPGGRGFTKPIPGGGWFGSSTVRCWALPRGSIFGARPPVSDGFRGVGLGERSGQNREGFCISLGQPAASGFWEPPRHPGKSNPSRAGAVKRRLGAKKRGGDSSAARHRAQNPRRNSSLLSPDLGLPPARAPFPVSGKLRPFKIAPRADSTRGKGFWKRGVGSQSFPPGQGDQRAPPGGNRSPSSPRGWPRAPLARPPPFIQIPPAPCPQASPVVPPEAAGRLFWGSPWLRARRGCPAPCWSTGRLGAGGRGWGSARSFGFDRIPAAGLSAENGGAGNCFSPGAGDGVHIKTALFAADLGGEEPPQGRSPNSPLMVFVAWRMASATSWPPLALGHQKRGGSGFRSQGHPDPDPVTGTTNSFRASKASWAMEGWLSPLPFPHRRPPPFIPGPGSHPGSDAARPGSRPIRGDGLWGACSSQPQGATPAFRASLSPKAEPTSPGAKRPVPMGGPGDQTTVGNHRRWAPKAPSAPPAPRAWGVPDPVKARARERIPQPKAGSSPSGPIPQGALRSGGGVMGRPRPSRRRFGFGSLPREAECARAISSAGAPPLQGDCHCPIPVSPFLKTPQTLVPLSFWGRPFFFD
ncbi:MAG: hypothetical protein CM15mP116_08730 [Synechococcus sp.]|nr:MAG: hypothetical protein CM15mP116_08730 [Synechococcus sp.]